MFEWEELQKLIENSDASCKKDSQLDQNEDFNKSANKTNNVVRTLNTEEKENLKLIEEIESFEEDMPVLEKTSKFLPVTPTYEIVTDKYRDDVDVLIRLSEEDARSAEICATDNEIRFKSKNQ